LNGRAIIAKEIEEKEIDKNRITITIMRVNEEFYQTVKKGREQCCLASSYYYTPTYIYNNTLVLNMFLSYIIYTHFLPPNKYMIGF